MSGGGRSTTSRSGLLPPHPVILSAANDLPQNNRKVLFCAQDDGGGKHTRRVSRYTFAASNLTSLTDTVITTPLTS